MSVKKLGLTSEGITSPEELQELMVRIAEKHPIELEERINTLNKPLIIDSACPGWQPKYWGPPKAYPGAKPVGYVEGGVRYPAVTISIQDQVRAQIEAVKAGAATVHIHPRDPKTGLASHDADLLKQVYDGIFAEVDPISIQHNWERLEDREVDYKGHYAHDLLRIGNGGNRYCQAAVVLWPPADDYPYHYTQYVQDGVRFMQEHNIKPIHMIRSTYSTRRLKRALIDTNILTEKPYVLVHDMGHPFGWPMDIDPWMPIDMIVSLIQTKERLGEDNVIGVFPGGRNWMPIAMTAILLGVDFVRVGIEDCYWMYPHKDEVIQKNIDAVNKIVEFCKLIGREIATIDQARQILGIKKTT